MRELLLLLFLAVAASTVADQSPLDRRAAEAAAIVEEGGNRVPRPRVPTIDEMIHRTPDKMFAGVEEAQRAAMRATPPTHPSVAEMVTKALTGGDGTIEIAPLDQRAVNAEAGMQKAAQAAFKEKSSYGHWDRFKAGMDETLIGQLVEHMGEQNHEFDPAFMSFYKAHWQDIESFAKTDDEVAQIREATSAEHLQTIKAQIEEDRHRETVINSSDMGTAVRMGTNAATMIPALFLIGAIAARRRQKRRTGKNETDVRG